MKTFFDTYTFTIAANGIYRLDSYNRFITLLENSSSTAVRVSIGPGQARAELAEGLSVELPQDEHFKFLMFENTTGSSMTITIALSTGRVYDNRLVLSAMVDVDFTANTIETPAALAVPADPAAAVTIAADSDQKELIMENTGNFAVWVGDSSVDASAKQGKSIEPGGTLILTTTATVYLQADAAGASQVSYMKLTKV